MDMGGRATLVNGPDDPPCAAVDDGDSVTNPAQPDVVGRPVVTGPVPPGRPPPQHSGPPGRRRADGLRAEVGAVRPVNGSSAAAAARCGRGCSGSPGRRHSPHRSAEDRPGWLTRYVERVVRGDEQRARRALVATGAHLLPERGPPPGQPATRTASRPEMSMPSRGPSSRPSRGCVAPQARSSRRRSSGRYPRGMPPPRRRAPGGQPGPGRGREDLDPTAGPGEGDRLTSERTSRQQVRGLGDRAAPGPGDRQRLPEADRHRRRRDPSSTTARPVGRSARPHAGWGSATVAEARTTAGGRHTAQPPAGGDAGRGRRASRRPR